MATDFVFLSTRAWSELGGAFRSAHFARELLTRGERVLWVEYPPSAAQESRAQLTIVNAFELGFDEHTFRRAWFGLNPENETRVGEQFARVLTQFETHKAQRVAIFRDPFAPFVARVPLLRERGYTIVYDAVDDFQALSDLGLYFAHPLVERWLVANADLITAVSPTIVERLSAWEPRAPIYMLRQGYALRDYSFISNSAPAAFARGKVTLGFWGLVNAFNVSVELIEHVAWHRPTWQIHLLGPVDTDPRQAQIGGRLRALANVHLPGTIAHQELPRWLAGFDVALIPFPNNAFNRARDPLKVFEYLPGYKPVVATNLPQLAGMPYVYLASTPQEFLDTIERALTIPVERSVVDAYLEGCTWSARLDQLLAWLQEISPARENALPDASLWYSDAALAPNVREYIARTEQLLNERTAYIHALKRDADAKQAHIEKLQSVNPLWLLKRLFSRE